MIQKNAQTGVTLIELMIAVAIIGVISAIALPFYQDYMATARSGSMVDSIRTIALMQTERRSQEGEYAEGTYDVPGGITTLTTNLGWSARTTPDRIKYVVVCAVNGSVAGECARASGYTVTVTHPDAVTETVERTYTP